MVRLKVGLGAAARRAPVQALQHIFQLLALVADADAAPGECGLPLLGAVPPDAGLRAL